MSTNRIPKELLIADLQRVYKEQGRITHPIYKEYGVYSPAPVLRAFITWNQALVEAGLPVEHRLGTGRYATGLDLEPKQIKPRRCLSCSKLFPSEGAHIRRCDRCKYYAENVMNIAEGWESVA